MLFRINRAQAPGEFRDALGGVFADHLQRIADTTDRRAARVDHIDRDVGTHAAHQRRRRIDRQRRSDHHQDVGPGGKFRRTVEFGNRLAEEDDVRTQQRTVGSAVVETLLDAVERQDERRIVRRAQFGEFAVEVKDMCKAWDGAMQMYADEARAATRKEMKKEMKKEMRRQAREKDRRTVFNMFSRGYSQKEIAAISELPLKKVQKMCEGFIENTTMAVHTS